MEKMPDPKPERPDLDDYLKCDEIVDFDEPSIEEASEQLTEGLKGNVAKAQALYEFVRDQIFHSFDINATSITIKASEVLEKGHGTCYAQAHLLAALMRAADIPAGFCYQLVKTEGEGQAPVVHGYNAVYLEELGKWIRLDASRPGDEKNSWAELDMDFSHMGPLEDSVVYEDPTIYISPSKRVIKALRQYDTVDDLEENLPVRI